MPLTPETSCGASMQILRRAVTMALPAGHRTLQASRPTVMPAPAHTAVSTRLSMKASLQATCARNGGSTVRAILPHRSPQATLPLSRADMQRSATKSSLPMHSSSSALMKTLPPHRAASTILSCVSKRCILSKPRVRLTQALQQAVRRSSTS